MQAIFFHPDDPAAGVVGQAFRVAGLQTRGAKRAAVASAHHVWHERCRAQTGPMTVGDVLGHAKSVAQQQKIEPLLSEGLSVVVGQMEAYSAIQAAERELGQKASSADTSRVQEVATAAREAAAEAAALGRDGRAAAAEVIQRAYRLTPPGLAQAGIANLRAQSLAASSEMAKMAREGGAAAMRAARDTGRAMLDYGSDAMDTAEKVMEEGRRTTTAVSTAVGVAAASAALLGVLLFLRTG